MTNTLLLRLATVLMLFSINTVQAQTLNEHITNTTADDRYILHEAHSDGTRTVTDTVTGLMWQRCSDGQTVNSDCGHGQSVIGKRTWSSALGVAVTANEANNGAGTAGYTNWRLPNIKELQSIVAYDRFNPSINSFAFPNVVFPPTANQSYWSSSPNIYNSNNAWSVEFHKGKDGDDDRSAANSVRLVRSPQ